MILYRDEKKSSNKRIKKSMTNRNFRYRRGAPDGREWPALGETCGDN